MGHELDALRMKMEVSLSGIRLNAAAGVKHFAPAVLSGCPLLSNPHLQSPVRQTLIQGALPAPSQSPTS